jgi:nitrate reductase gamma subunit
MKAHTFTETRILNIHGTKSHCGCICVFGRWCGFQIFPISVSVQCSVPNNASQQCFTEFTNFGMDQRCYSEVQL